MVKVGRKIFNVMNPSFEAGMHKNYTDQIKCRKLLDSPDELYGWFDRMRLRIGDRTIDDLAEIWWK